MKTYTEEEVKKLTNEAHSAGYTLSRCTGGITKFLENKKFDHLRFEEWWKNNKKK
jgi:hypothetical protein